MLANIAIYFFLALCAFALWHVAFAQYNRRQALRVLRWIESSLTGHGHVAGLTWVSSSQFCVPLRLKSQVFQQPRVRVQLTPRTIPFFWLRHRWRKERESLIFEADLDNTPAFDLQVFNHRWCGRTRRNLNPDPKGWLFDCSGPFLVSSRAEWGKEVTGMMNAVLNTRDREFYNVRFRSTSPHFTATVPLESISPTAQNRGHVFAAFGELAAEASALQD
jgi:hypothetical protein